MIQSLNSDDSLNKDFVPQVIKLCEYEYFLMNMIEAANTMKSREAALEKSEVKSGFNLSGCYQVATELVDSSSISSYYTYQGAPWYFRKMLVAASKRLSDVVILHEPNDELVFKYTVPFFGRKHKVYKLDNVIRESENMWGAKVRTLGRESEKVQKVYIKNEKPSYARDGYGLNTFSWEMIGGERLLRWAREIYDDENDDEAVRDKDDNILGPVIYFRSVDTDIRGSRK